MLIDEFKVCETVKDSCDRIALTKLLTAMKNLSFLEFILAGVYSGAFYFKLDHRQTDYIFSVGINKLRDGFISLSMTKVQDGTFKRCEIEDILMDSDVSKKIKTDILFSIRFLNMFSGRQYYEISDAIEKIESTYE